MQEAMCPFCMAKVQTEICPRCGKDVRYSGYPSHLPVGSSLTGKNTYLLGASLGQGGFGITYIALDSHSGHRVAVKEYFPSHCCIRENSLSVIPGYGQEDTYLKGKTQFLLEAQMLQSLSDLKCVVNVLDYFEANNTAYLVMEYLEGHSLKDQVEKCGKIPAQTFLQQLKPLMTDMEKMHKRGVVHRDIAPDNIILLPDGRLKLIDFGAARSFVGDHSMTVVVKKGFAPVEQYMRKGSNASTDVYALAATIYYCVTGIVPPDSAERQYGNAVLRAPTELGAELSPEQELALEQALQIQPKDRTPSVAVLSATLSTKGRPAAATKSKPEQTQKSSAAPRTKAEKKQKLPAAPKTKKTRLSRLFKTKPEKTASTEKTAVSAANAPKRKSALWITAAILVPVLICVALFMLKPAGSPDLMHTEPKATAAAATTPTVPTEARVLSPEELAYNNAVDLFRAKEYGQAAVSFAKLGDFQGSKDTSFQIWDAIIEKHTIFADNGSTVAIQEDGTVLTCGHYAPTFKGLENISLLKLGFPNVGLTADRRAFISDTRGGSRMIEEEDWTDLVDIETDGSTVFGLKYDGTVLIHQIYEYPQWKMGEDDVPDYLQNYNGFETILNYKIEDQDVRATCSLYHGIIYLHKDGTVTFGRGYRGKDEDIADKIEADVAQWTDIVSITSSGWEGLIGLKADGTVVATGTTDEKQLDVQGWTDIVDIAISSYHTVGLRSDGTLLTCGSSRNDARWAAERWTNIKVPAGRDAILAAIELDYIT